ncbi:MAG: hypothetical protein P4M13_08585 [Alphaproteobacteria bacterium]|nr:hypothetical protein [Alphaproteobacteria bacterium]
MATSPALVNAIVQAIQEEKSSVEVTLRRLRDAGLIPVGGRGPYAVTMDLTSAMRLLLGVCAFIPLESRAAEKAVNRFESLPGGYEGGLAAEGVGGLEDIHMAIDELRPEHTLGEALIRLLEAGGRGELFTYKDTDGARRSVYSPIGRGYLRVKFFLPVPIARIEHVLGASVKKIWKYGENISEEGYLSALRDRHLGGRKYVIETDEYTFEYIGSAILK